MYNGIDIRENKPLDRTAVLPMSSFLAICLVDQYEMKISEIKKQVVIHPINAHKANSSGVNLLVINKMKTRPVKRLIIPITKAINPEQATRILLNK